MDLWSDPVWQVLCYNCSWFYNLCGLHISQSRSKSWKEMCIWRGWHTALLQLFIALIISHFNWLQFFIPTGETESVPVSNPATQISQVKTSKLPWLIPSLKNEEKINSLYKPKSIRRKNKGTYRTHTFRFALWMDKRYELRIMALLLKNASIWLVSLAKQLNVTITSFGHTLTCDCKMRSSCWTFKHIGPFLSQTALCAPCLWPTIWVCVNHLVQGSQIYDVTFFKLQFLLQFKKKKSLKICTNCEE